MEISYNKVQSTIPNANCSDCNHRQKTKRRGTSGDKPKLELPLTLAMNGDAFAVVLSLSLTLSASHSICAISSGAVCIPLESQLVLLLVFYSFQPLKMLKKGVHLLCVNVCNRQKKAWQTK